MFFFVFAGRCGGHLRARGYIISPTGAPSRTVRECLDSTFCLCSLEVYPKQTNRANLYVFGMTQNNLQKCSEMY